MYFRLNYVFTFLLSTFNNINYIPKYKIRNLIFNIYNIKSKGNNSLEHIVPQSIFKDNKNISKDLHNILIYPSKVNTHRSNYKYISDPKFYEDSKIINNNGDIVKYENILNDNFFIKSNKNKVFYPKKQYRGEISRAAIYFCHTYPEYRDEIFDKVIDPYTMLSWHHEYPISNFERYKSLEIEKLQGNINIFVNDPKKAVEFLEEILDIKFYIYENYDYNK